MIADGIPYKLKEMLSLPSRTVDSFVETIPIFYIFSQRLKINMYNFDENNKRFDINFLSKTQSILNSTV